MSGAAIAFLSLTVQAMGAQPALSSVPSPSPGTTPVPSPPPPRPPEPTVTHAAAANGGGVDLSASRGTVRVYEGTTPSDQRAETPASGYGQRTSARQATVVRDAAGNTFTRFMSGCVGVQLDPGRYGPVGEEVACVPGEPGPEEVVAPVQIVFTAQEMQSLPIDPGTLTMQPDRGNVLINIDTVAYTDAVPQTFETAVLGVPVTVRVWPVEYAWDWGDGTVFTTTDPGAPWPQYTVGHTYLRATAEGETRTITVTTSWHGDFSVAGGPPQPVDGTAVTSTATTPFEVITASTSLTTGEEIGRG